MPEAIDMTRYASPIVRMGMAMMLYPGMQVEFFQADAKEWVRGMSGNGRFNDSRCDIVIVCRIRLPDGLGTYDGWKEVNTKSTSLVDLASHRTKALGRALKQIGMPSVLPEMQLLMQYTALMRLDAKDPDVRSAVAALAQPILGAPPDEDEDELEEPEMSEEQLAQQAYAALWSGLSGSQRRELSDVLRKLDPPITNALRPGPDRIVEATAIVNKMMAVEEPEEPF